jgi:hypothetical protein
MQNFNIITDNEIKRIKKLWSTSVINENEAEENLDFTTILYGIEIEEIKSIYCSNCTKEILCYRCQQIYNSKSDDAYQLYNASEAISQYIIKLHQQTKLFWNILVTHGNTVYPCINI